jgi:TonB family protein
MTTYIFKTILCSAILILIYYLVLEREKIYRFNRFYLLFSIVFSLIVPLITIKIRQAVSLIPETVYQPVGSIQDTFSQQTLPSVNESITPGNIFLLVYITVTLFLLCRFIINIFVLFTKIRNNDTFPYHGAKLVLIKDNHVPHSFLNYVFIYKEDYDKGNIEKEIFSHEMAHVKQRHSIDILLIEFITLFAWINPLLFIYRKAIQLNHEFLADEFVVNTFTSPRDYQLLLLDKARKPSVLVLSSSFNYLQTKKRIIMMSKKTSLRIAILKQIALIPVIVITGFLFATKVIAQDSKKTVQKQASTSPEQQKQSPENDPSFKHDRHSLSMGFSSWVAGQIKYPSESLKNNVKGWVHVGYTVELNGTISNVKINSAPDPVLGEAVAKVVRNSPKWMSGVNTTNKSPFKSAVSIKFEIPEKVISSEDIPVFAFGKIPIFGELTVGIEVDQIPQFPQAKAATEESNEEAIRGWVDQNLRYPEKAIKGKIEGPVMVRFIVAKNGKLEDFLVIRSVSPVLNDEALRVLSLMPDWKPAMQGGEAKNVYYNAIVEFKLPK